MTGTSSHRRRAGLALAAGSLVAGMTQYLYQVLAARVLDERAFGVVAVLWTIQYLVFAVFLYQIEVFLVARHTLRQRGADAPSPAPALVGYVLAVAAGAGVVAWALRERFFYGEDALVAVVVASTLTYGAYVGWRGDFARRGAATSYALLTGGESLLRLVLALGIAAVAATRGVFAWTVFAGAAVLVVSLTFVRRCDPRPSLDGNLCDSVPPDPLAAAFVERAQDRSSPWAFLGSYALANIGAQALLAGGPLVLPLIGGSASATATAFVALGLLRAPLVLGYSGLLTTVVPVLVAAQQSGTLRGTVRRFAALTVALAVVAGVVAAAIGPSVVAFVFAEALRPPAAFVGMAAGASVLALGNLLLNQVLVVCGRENALSVPWAVAVAVAAGVLALAPQPLTGVAAALLAGELVAGTMLLRLSTSDAGARR